jgi:hypothetical protein
MVFGASLSPVVLRAGSCWAKAPPRRLNWYPFHLMQSWKLSHDRLVDITDRSIASSDSETTQ